MAHILIVDPGELGELLATLFGQYGLQAERARTGEEALDRALNSTPALVVVDMALPDVPGIEVAELLRTELGTKAVLMYPPQTVAERDDALMARISAMDGSFLRPFRSLTLVEFVARLLGVPLQRDQAPVVGPLSSTEGPAVQDAELHDDSGELLLDINTEIRPADEVKDAPAAAPAAQPVALPLAQQIAAPPFSPGGLGELWERAKARRQSTHAQATTSTQGALSPRALADLLDAFHQSQTTGEVWLQNGRARRVLFLRRGVITGARSNVEGEDIIGLSLRMGLLDASGVLMVRDDMTAASHKNVLDAIVARGLLSEPQLRQLVTEHVRLVVQRSFTWSSGAYQCTFDGRATREPVVAQVAVGDAIVRGILQTESDDALAQAAPDDARFTPATDSGHGLNDLTLSRDEARIVVAMDGTKTILDLCILFDDVPRRLVRGLAAGLLCLGLLRFAGWGHAAARKISYF